MLIIIIKVKDTIVLIFDSHKLNVVILEGPGSSLSKNLKIELSCNSLSDGVNWGEVLGYIVAVLLMCVPARIKQDT